MFLHDAVREAESQTRPFALRFGGEKGIENPGEIFGAYSGTVVLDPEPYFLVGTPGAQCDLPIASVGFKGLARIAENIEHHLLQLMSVAQNRGQVGTVFLLQRNIARAQIVNR